MFLWIQMKNKRFNWKKYFNEINKPELFKDEVIVILVCGTKIDNNNCAQLISEFCKKNGVNDDGLEF